MAINKKRKVAAYKEYFQKKYKEEVMEALSESKSMEDADTKLDKIITKYDSAWTQVMDYYSDVFKEGEEDE